MKVLLENSKNKCPSQDRFFSKIILYENEKLKTSLMSESNVYPLPPTLSLLDFQGSSKKTCSGKENLDPNLLQDEL